MSQKDMQMLLDKISHLEDMIEGLTTRVLTAEKRVAAAEKLVYPDGKRPSRYEVVGQDNYKDKQKKD